MSLPEPYVSMGPQELAATIEEGERLVQSVEDGLSESERKDVFLLALAGRRHDVMEARRILHTPDTPCSFHSRMGRELSVSAYVAHTLLDWQRDLVPVEMMVKNLRDGRVYSFQSSVV